MGGTPGFSVGAIPVVQGSDYANLSILTDQGARQLLVVDTRSKGYVTDKSTCHSIAGKVRIRKNGKVRFRATVPLVHRGLPLVRDLKAGLSYGAYYFDGRCLHGGGILVHLRLHLDADGKPASALVAVQLTRTKRNVVFIRWSAQRVSDYFWPKCPTL